MRKKKKLKVKGLKSQVKTDWDLSLMYKSAKELDRHMDKIEKIYLKFAKKYSGKDFTKSDTKLLNALKDYERLVDAVPHGPYRYLDLKKSLDSNDQGTESRLRKTEERFRKISNRVVFFELKLGNISKVHQKKLLKDARFEYFAYFLENVFEKARFQLSEPEEKILNLKSQPSYGMWVDGREKAQNKLSIEHKGADIPISEATQIIAGDMSIKERRDIWRKSITELKKTADFAESELNAVVVDKKITDELRGYKKPYSSTVLSYENTEEEVEKLVSEVTRSFGLSRKFYALKAQVLNLKDAQYTDRYAKVGKLNKRFTFTDSLNILMRSFEDTNIKYSSILGQMAKRGQIDAYPRQGKHGGAFCSGAEKLPTYVLLNHTDDFNSLMTFAHEMGHAIHYERSKQQELLYQQYTTSVAECASTFFENIAFWEVYGSLSNEEKITALATKIDGKIATIFRQIAFFNFELELHNEIRQRGSLSHAEIAQMMKKHLQSYCGKALQVTEDDGYSFLYIPHFRYKFYVYAYAYGELISSALYKRYQENPAYINEIDRFLSAGGSKSPYDIFKDIGIDTRDPNFWKEGLSEIDREISEFKRLVENN
jgi:oligoendopeptidase F